MGHRLAFEPVAMQPNAAVEGETHALAAARELPIERRYWQAMRPSTVAGATAGPVPENREHWRPGALTFVALADQPLAVADAIVRTTPVVGVKLFIREKLVEYFALS
jgi:hypothetical protein